MYLKATRKKRHVAVTFEDKALVLPVFQSVSGDVLVFSKRNTDDLDITETVPSTRKEASTASVNVNLRCLVLHY